MIETLEHLRVTQAYLSSMEEGLAELLRSVPADAASRRETLAQPYVEEIDRVREEIDAFLHLRRKTAQVEHADLTIGLRGRLLQLGSAPISVVTGTVDAIRRGLQALAALLQGREPGLTGRVGKDVEDACDLRLLAVGSGSVAISLGLPASPQLDLLPHDSLGGRAADWFVQVAAWASSDAGEESFPDARKLVGASDGHGSSIALAAWQVVKTLPREGSPLEEIYLEGRLVQQGRITMNRFTRERLYGIIDKGRKKEERSVVGIVRGLDLDSGTFLLRVAQRSQRLRCFFEPLFQRDVIGAAGLRVRVSGPALLDPATGLEREIFARQIEVLGQPKAVTGSGTKRKPRRKRSKKKRRNAGH